MIALSLLVLALQGGAEAMARTPEPAPEPTLMIVEFTSGAPMIGFPAHCPGAPPDEPASESICLAEVYQGPVRVVRHLSGPRLGRRSLVRLTAHARRWRAGTRMIVATRPFEDQGTTGQFAVWWQSPEADGDFCMTEEDLAQGGDPVLVRAFGQGYGRRFRARGYIERADFRCIRGERRGH